MPRYQDEPSHPMLQITRSMGAIEKGIESLESQQSEIGAGQKEVEEKVAALHQRVAKLVTQDECFNRRTEIETVVKGGTYPEHPVVKRPTGRRGWLPRMAGHAGDITKVFALLALIGTALWAAHGFIARLERTMEANELKQEKANQQLLRRLDESPEPKVIYVPIKPDVGVRRRRRRRPRKNER
ncbi:MAG: hypothetical protein KJN79_00185 [Gammaproteobacteria bacterium]|nr:hypothetical protein [Gammaproteobacteria bacterium]